MKMYDMIYRLKIKDGNRTGYKYGCTNQHAENRACNVERSARANGHERFSAKADGYYYNPERSYDIAKAERSIHSNPKLRKLSDGGHPFNGSSEIYDKREAGRINKDLKKIMEYVSENAEDDGLEGCDRYGERIICTIFTKWRITRKVIITAISIILIFNSEEKMKCYWLMNHACTDEQFNELNNCFGVSEVIYPSEELKKFWSNLPCSTEYDLDLIFEWLEKITSEAIAVVQGDSTYSFYVVNALMDKGIRVFAAVTHRDVSEIECGNTTKITRVFSHIAFREYIKPEKGDAK